VGPDVVRAVYAALASTMQPGGGTRADLDLEVFPDDVVVEQATHHWRLDDDLAWNPLALRLRGNG